MFDLRIATLLLGPSLLAAIAFGIRLKKVNEALTFIAAATYLFCAVSLFGEPASVGSYFCTDSLNSLFLLVLALLFAAVSIANLAFFRTGKFSNLKHTYYTASLLVFLSAMAGVILSSHFAVLWIFVEFTTLSSAYLIYFNGSKHALEATWKYIFICSIGITLAFVGVILLSLSVGELNSLSFADLYTNAKAFSPLWLKLSFVFTIVGFGTKVGLAPVHAWLPDAHSEAPSPISALLSGTLLNSALLAILRMNRLMREAGLETFANSLLLTMGFLSLLVSASYVLRVRNYKRMLAYSSIENMGIIVIAASLGKLGAFAAVLHVVAHSLTKASFFLTAGNIVARFGTKKTSEVSGIVRRDPWSAWLWVFSFVALAGIPPFPAFFSELMIARALVAGSHWFLLGLFLILLLAIVYGMGQSVFGMSFGDPVAGHGHEATGNWANYIPQVVLLVLAALVGLALVPQINLMLNAASRLL